MALSIPLIFEDIAAAKSNAERKKILLEHESNPLKELLKYAFHPDIKFALPEGTPPYKTFIGSVDENNPTYLYPNIRKFYLYIEGGHEGEGNIDISPLFSDAENDDYSLQSASPCIDTGTADLDGDGIDDIIDYYGLAPDMGAYEYESEYDFNLGDVNFDNEINILDVVLMVSFILGEPTDEYEYSAADINQDGLLNILDIVALVNIILGN